MVPQNLELPSFLHFNLHGCAPHLRHGLTRHGLSTDQPNFEAKSLSSLLWNSKCRSAPTAHSCIWRETCHQVCFAAVVLLCYNLIENLQAIPLEALCSHVTKWFESAAVAIARLPPLPGDHEVLQRSLPKLGQSGARSDGVHSVGMFRLMSSFILLHSPSRPPRPHTPMTRRDAFRG